MMTTNFTPQEIVSELDKFIIGQQNAKKQVAIAIRNRWRRQQLPKDIQREIVPKNILMIGPTGVGKTEIARRLSYIEKSPFIKVEATKFTEIGYVGRDVEQIIRDLMEISIKIEKEKEKEKNITIAKEQAINKIVDILAGKVSSEETKRKFKQKVLNNELDNSYIKVKITEKTQPPSFDVGGGQQIGMMGMDSFFPKNKSKTKQLTVKQAIEVLTEEELDDMIDQDTLIHNAKYSVENSGIIFIDEIDKITDSQTNQKGNVSREGVQRDLLPLVEGTIVNTKHGTINTNHILFIASGAFHIASPSDLLPELQGRFPIRVSLESLKKEDFIQILLNKNIGLVHQYIQMLKTEGVNLILGDDVVELIAEYTQDFNTNIEDIGARRLHTLMEKILEDINYDPAISYPSCDYEITKELINKKLSKFSNNIDLSKFII